jgi:hypothetical protein
VLQRLSHSSHAGVLHQVGVAALKLAQAAWQQQQQWLSSEHAMQAAEQICSNMVLQ